MRWLRAWRQIQETGLPGHVRAMSTPNGIERSESSQRWVSVRKSGIAVVHQAAKGF